MTTYKILVVDDDQDDREIMNEAFQMNGYKDHLILSSAQEVFLYLQSVDKDENLPHLILTDLNMPGISGHELLIALRSMDRYKNIDIIVYSTSNMGSHIDMCLALGAREYITKPAVIDDYKSLAKRITSKVEQ